MTDPYNPGQRMRAPDIDPRLEKIEQDILALGYGTAGYHDALGFYFLTLARSQWRRADSIRDAEADSAQRRARAAARTGRG